MSGFHVAARQVSAGKATHESLVQPAWSHSSHFTSGRTPWGPSSVQSSGMPRRGTPGLLNFDWAWIMLIFSWNVMRRSASSTRSSTGRLSSR